MPKRKNLNGIPHNITKSFFGTERYYNGGYMADWLLNAAKQLHLSEASLDVLNVSFNPPQLNFKPLTIHAKDLRLIVYKELSGNGFEKEFIKEVRIDFQFPDPKMYKTTIYCFPYLIDRDGKRYETGRMVEEGLEPEFNPFEEMDTNQVKTKTGFLDRLRNLFR